MTVQNCIESVDGIEPNAYTAAQKAGWISECEGKVYSQLFLTQPYEFTPITEADSRILALPAPYDRMYPRYLQAMIHYANGEYDRYANSMAVFNEAWAEANRWFGGDFDVTDRLRNQRFEGTITPEIGDQVIMEIPGGCAVAAGRIVINPAFKQTSPRYRFTGSPADTTYCYQLEDTWYSFSIPGHTMEMTYYDPDGSHTIDVSVFAKADEIVFYDDHVRVSRVLPNGFTAAGDLTVTANSHTGYELDWTCGFVLWGLEPENVIVSGMLTDKGTVPAPMILAGEAPTKLGITLGPGYWSGTGDIRFTGHLLIPDERWSYEDRYARRRDARWQS